MNTLQVQARRVLSLMDLTSLNDEDTVESIKHLCAGADSSAGRVAAVCVYPRYIRCAKVALGQSTEGVRVATVTNFPDGAVDLLGATEATAAAVEAGADEVDVVFPWRSLLAGDSMVGEELVQACRRACGSETKLKIIIESGHLAAPALIRQASEICVASGADFIKTSTGKLTIGATPAAVQVMAEVLRDNDTSCGIKVSGGIRTQAQAMSYIRMVEEIIGLDWATPETFRIGASSLLESLREVIVVGNEQNNE